MQITLPDDHGLTQRARAAGFASVEAYLLQLVERDIQAEPPSSLSDDIERQSANDWVQDFDAWLQTLKSHNPDFDDSRESIYPVR